MKLYLDNGYVNIKGIIDLGLPFNFIVGGRGTGKTYGALQEMIDGSHKFFYFRRTQSQVDIISRPEFCPFKILNKNRDWNINTAPITKYNNGFYNFIEIDGKQKPSGAPLGYISALSTFANLRGFDGSDTDILIYDEFIPEKHERPIKEEASAFFNSYETINRNRELNGQKPLQVLALANANDLGNPIFMELKLINKAERMRRTGQEISIDYNKGIGLFILNDSNISEAKANTALYKITSGTDYNEMALGNNFADMESRSIKSMPLQEYRPIVTIGEITIYKHKNNKGYYISTHRNGSPPEFGTSDVERSRFFRSYNYLWDAYMRDAIRFESAAAEILFSKYFD